MLELQESSSKIDEYISYLKKNTNQPRALAKLFKTDSSYYIYDTGTSKVISCSEFEYKTLEKIISGKIDEIVNMRNDVSDEEYFQAIENIKNAIEEEDILKAGNDFKFVSPGHLEELDEELDSRVRQIVLELTGKCNLRCGYCIYSENYNDRRNFNENDMTEDIAKKAIDYANLHGDKEEGVAITFYGGEPLIKFDLLKNCIEYAKKTIKDKELTFSLTSNLTLMTKEIAEYLASVEGLSITCSIDGPQDVHDSSRKDINGNGSFERAIRGLKYIVETLRDSAEERVTLSMVFNRPYSFEKLKEIALFFKGLDWLPEKISKNVTYPTVNNIDYDEVERIISQNGESPDYLRIWSEESYLHKLKNSEDKEFFSKTIIESPFVRIHRRPIFIKYIKDNNLNGCCVPGGRKIYVTANGDFLVCERIDGSPVIGNVYDGVDKKKVKELLVEEYANEALNDCKNCWASRLCEICYAMCFNSGKIDMKKKRYYCNFVRKHMEKSIILYHKCLEINPKELEYLNDFILR
ncbi:radical SAM protein [Clostridium pasteurianum]|uniref:Arylsulfatase regulator (Fe-S oxidoreductase) n=1 Tax=Clostridium pasteurianum BC1 TaxID=86416 RepID=R4K6A8_CLOPA|nr:radical SAM protein [Clostridium pasteurianum]AGK96019.1 arylsulfatase regulator (Fe-S oxidoreductase) [Clostridium pasteurianum BC1]